MATVYMKVGNTFRPASDRSLDVHKELPAGTFALKFNPEIGFFLEEIDDYTLPSKIYGEANKNADRIFETFQKREAATGVLLHGEKGSGKTLLVKMLATKAREAGMPTIVVNTEFVGESFNTLMQSITQRALVIFDEFEKVYDEEAQPKLLTLLDGVYPTPKLFLLTCNNVHLVSQYLENRPGRIFYSIGYDSISAEFIREYCQDNLINKQYVNQIVRMRPIFYKFNFDMLKALVEEMNRYDETPEQALNILNVRADFNNERKFSVDMMIGGKSVKLYRTDMSLNPAMVPFSLQVYATRKAKKGESRDSNGNTTYLKTYQFTPNDIYDVTDFGDFEFRRDELSAVLTRTYAKKFNYHETLDRIDQDEERIMRKPDGVENEEREFADLDGNDSAVIDLDLSIGRSGKIIG